MLKNFVIVGFILLTAIFLNLFYIENKKKTNYKKLIKEQTKIIIKKESNNQALLKSNEMMKSFFYATGGAIEETYKQNKNNTSYFERLVLTKIKERGLSKYDLVDNITYPLNPADSWVTMEYGRQLFRSKYIDHNGIDMNSVDLRVFTVEDGTVDKVSYSHRYGNYLIIKHNNGKNLSLYAHLSKIYPTEGKEVKKGDKIGIIGDSGHPNFCTAAHLHFIWSEKIKNKKGRYVYRTKNIFSNSKIRKYYIGTDLYTIW